VRWLGHFRPAELLVVACAGIAGDNADLKPTAGRFNDYKVTNHAV
jgi:hypothetical protein